MTAYEMRISDWSSDVCSSDLIANTPLLLAEISIQLLLHFTLPPRYCACVAGAAGLNDDILEAFLEPVEADKQYSARSEERRVGKECVRTFRSRWSPDN